MPINIINPYNGLPLRLQGSCYTDSLGSIFPIKDGVVTIANDNNYSRNFGFQWNTFSRTQLDQDHLSLNQSAERFFSETGWSKTELKEKNVLEVGSGAGRFSEIILKQTEAVLYSVDYSDAVKANYANNSSIAPERFKLFQANIYQLPFEAHSFDKVFCFGVLQHTPDFEASVQSLINQIKLGGEIAVDFYPIRGWWTKIHAKYILRPIFKRLSHKSLLSLIERNIDWLIRVHFFLNRIGCNALNRFLPLCDISGTFPNSLAKAERREWAILDTFDMFSPAYDSPQRISDVASWFTKYGVKVVFAGYVSYGNNSLSAVVRGVRCLKDTDSAIANANNSN